MTNSNQLFNDLDTDELISTKHTSPLWNSDKFIQTTVTQHDKRRLSSSSYRSTMLLFTCYVWRIALGWISCLAWMINKHINLKTSLKNSLVFARWVSCVKRRFRCLTFTWVWINRSQRNEKTSVNALQECVPFICVLFLIVWSRNVTFPAQNPLK